MEIRGLKSKEELTDLFGLYEKVFKKTPLSYFKNRLLNDPYFVPQDVRVAIEDNRIVSTITVYRRKMYWRGKEVTFGGIGNVATLPEYGGRGLSTGVMNNAIAYMKQNGFLLSILYTGINRFYERAGFITPQAWQARLTITEIASGQFKIREFEQSDLNAVQELYLRFNKKSNGPLIREPEYWRANLLFAEKNERFLVAEKDKVQAYIRVVPENTKGEVWEFAYDDENAFLELLSFVSNFLDKKELTTAAILPRDFFQKDLPVKIEYEPSDITMYLVLNPEVKKIIGEFENYCFWWTDNF
ncbi:GNAT family N-acetyltransferase [Caldithrix abyssi]